MTQPTTPTKTIIFSELMWGDCSNLLQYSLQLIDELINCYVVAYDYGGMNPTNIRIKFYRLITQERNYRENNYLSRVRDGEHASNSHGNDDHYIEL